MTTKKEILDWIEAKKDHHIGNQNNYVVGYIDALDIIKDKLQQLPF